MQVIVEWTRLTLDDPRWDCRGCLYAYVDFRSGKLLYVGKADSSSVYQRTRGRHKRDIFRFLDQEYGGGEPGVIQGELGLDAGRRFSSQLLGDVESLLIYRLKPPANISGTQTRSFCRPGMR